MIPIWFRWLQSDAKRMIEEVDRVTNGKLDVDKIMELQWQVGKMGGRIEERVKDLKRKPNSIYVELLSELEKRHFRLCSILIGKDNENRCVKNIAIYIKVPNQRTQRQDKKCTSN